MPKIRPGTRLKPLEPRETRFVLEYLKDLNAPAAYRRVGFHSHHSDVMGSRMLSRPHVAAAIAVAIEERSRALKIDAQYVLTHLRDMFEARYSDLIASDGGYKPARDWPDVWQRMLEGADIEQVEVKKGRKTRVVRVRFLSRLKALELIGKHIDVRAFVTQAELSGPEGGPIPTAPVYVIYSDKMRPDSMKKAKA